MKSLQLIALLAMSTPTFGAIILQNGNFSSGTTGWSADANHASSSIMSVSGGVLNTGTGTTSLYQRASDTLLQAATITLDYTCNVAGSGANARNFDFRLFNGTPSGSNTNIFGLTLPTLSAVNVGSGNMSLTGGSLVAGTKYTLTLTFSGLDGAGNTMGTLNGSFSDGINPDITFTASNSDWAAFDGISFRHGSNWGTGQTYSLDNIAVAVPEPSVALLGGLGVLGLLHRRRR